jgi:phosphopantothenoylcysteine decarboxylase/phosphopantothenate--cysteine ligase
MDLKDKNILIGVSASIALYKAPTLVRRLRDQGASVKTVLSSHAAQLVSPQVFEAVSDERALVDEFLPSRESAMDHINLKNWAHYLLYYPATANLLGQLAHGLAGELISTVFLAVAPERVLICPAMNTDMYHHTVVQSNLEILRGMGTTVWEPSSGHLACGETGPGKLIEPEDLIQRIKEW